jgi:hypothetical protein
MTWTKKKDTEQERVFWSHVEKVAEKVRASELHSNHRVGQNHTKDDSDRRSKSLDGVLRTGEQSLKRA